MQESIKSRFYRPYVAKGYTGVEDNLLMEPPPPSPPPSLFDKCVLWEGFIHCKVAGMESVSEVLFSNVGQCCC